jgi:hypothetical protein
MPIYVRADDVKVRVNGKVRFTDNPEAEPNKMSTQLLNRLIEEAEGQVEQDLSPRYQAPFQTVKCEPFSKLPLRPTQNIIRTLCELKAVERVLETDFGSGTVVEAGKYINNIKERYKEIINDNILAKIHDDGRQWKFPPLPQLMLNYFNTAADDGYIGTIYNTSQGDGDYPQKQINDPSESFWTGIKND